MSIATHILLATDFSEENTPAVGKAAELARAAGARMTVLHVHGHPPEPPEAVVPAERLLFSSDLDAESNEALEELKRTRLSDIDALETATVEHGITSRAIHDYAASHDVDLIVMGSHERSRLGHLFYGSVAEKVVRHAPCPVLVV